MGVDLKPVLSPVHDLGQFIREQRVAAQISVRGLAAKAGVSNPYLSQVERGLRRPSADILAQIAHGLSISVETLLTKAGVLPAVETSDVVSAVRTDDSLTERQKSSLIDIYTAFRRETTLAVAAAAAATASTEVGDQSHHERIDEAGPDSTEPTSPSTEPSIEPSA